MCFEVSPYHAYSFRTGCIPAGWLLEGKRKCEETLKNASGVAPSLARRAAMARGVAPELWLDRNRSSILRESSILAATFHRIAASTQPYIYNTPSVLTPIMLTWIISAGSDSVQLHLGFPQYTVSAKPEHRATPPRLVWGRARQRRQTRPTFRTARQKLRSER